MLKKERLSVVSATRYHGLNDIAISDRIVPHKELIHHFSPLIEQPYFGSVRQLLHRSKAMLQLLYCHVGVGVDGGVRYELGGADFNLQSHGGVL